MCLIRAGRLSERLYIACRKARHPQRVLLNCPEIRWIIRCRDGTDARSPAIKGRISVKPVMRLQRPVQDDCELTGPKLHLLGESSWAKAAVNRSTWAEHFVNRLDLLPIEPLHVSRPVCRQVIILDHLSEIEKLRTELPPRFLSDGYYFTRI
jgi:hypothetical protein